MVPLDGDEDIGEASRGYLGRQLSRLEECKTRGPKAVINGSVAAIRQLPPDTCSGGRNSGDGMARKLRIQYPRAVYHVMNRGDRRESIFHDDADRQRFIETLGEACGKTGWQVHAYCLMPNHFHLVLETPQPNLVAGMKRFLGTHTGRFNRRHKLFGHLFSGRYKALSVDSATPGYLKTATTLNGSVPAIRQLPLDTCSGGRNSATVCRANFGFSYPGGCVPRTR